MMFKAMKTGVLAAILISTAIFAHAQKKITEGFVTYKVDYLPTTEQEAIVSMLPTEQKVKFNGSMIRIETQQGPAAITILHDVLSNLGLVLIDVPVAQMQFAVKQTKEVYDKQKETEPKFSDFKATGEKKVIATYNTEKYTYKDDKGGTYELWATTDVELPTGFAGENFKEVKGSLIQYTKFQQGMKQTLTVKEIKEEKNGPYNLDVPKGYEIKTMEEIMAMQGGGE